MNDTSPGFGYLFALEQFGIKFGLDNIRALVAAAGEPHLAYPIVHVAGTNGKGSVTAMVDAMLRAAGYRSARFTSPHLRELNERFVINGVPASTADLENAATSLRQLTDVLIGRGELLSPPTFFEATTAIAFQLFRSAAAQVAVVEVGLGGRLDATNVVSPAITAITSIGYDHQQYLGSTLSEIAAEKAGIIKPGVPVVLGELPPEAFDPIVRIARERGAAVISAKEGTTLVDLGAAGPGRGRRIQLRTGRRDYGIVDLALAGDHQVGNAVVAVRIVEALASSGLDVGVDAVREGLAGVRWPGRLDRRQLADGRAALLDAAHNPEGAAALARYLQTSGEAPPPLVFAAMRDKDVREMLGVLVPHVRALVFTRASTPRSAEPADLAAAARTIGATCKVVVEPELERALAIAWSMAPTIVVAGSIFLLGDVMSTFGWS